MFKITKNATFTHDVTIHAPVDGGYDEQTLKVRYRILGLDKLTKFNVTVGDLDTQRDYCNAIVDGFDGLVDDDMKPIVCTTALREQLIDTSFVRVPIIHAYEQAMTKAKSKN
jgi:hypothetical protein